MRTLRRFSYVLVSLVLAVALGVATMLLDWGAAGQVGTLVFVAVSSIYWVAVRREDVTPADPEKKLLRSRNSGKRPVVLHFYSSFDLITLLRRPADMKVEKAFKGRAEFIFIEVGHPEAGRLMDSLRASVGDWLFFDTTGAEVARAGRLTADRMEQLIRQAS